MILLAGRGLNVSNNKGISVLPAFLKTEPNAGPLCEVKAFTVLHEQNNSCYYRLTDTSGSDVEPLAPDSSLSRAVCLEKSLLNVTLHQVAWYRVSDEQARLIFLSCAIPPNPAPCPNPMPAGQQIAVSWYVFRAIPPSYFDLIVGDDRTMCNVPNPTYGDLEMILEALNEPLRYQLVIEGAPITGLPMLQVRRRGE